VSDVVVVRDGPVLTLTLDRPERRNALDPGLLHDLSSAIDEAAADDDVRVVVLSGAGGRAFVSGADISKFEHERSSAEAVAYYDATTARIFDRLHGFPKPTIAQITGSCVGGGVALAVCCDLRICGESARFAIPAAKLGVGYGFAGLRRLVDLIGPAFAKELFFTARLFTAAEAYAMGLVNRVVPDGEVEGCVADYARTIAANAPLTVAAVKAIVGEVLKDPAARDLARCEELVRTCFASRDYVEGREAFLEKRPPRFIGA
jgi:enoyl-CoA hydratase/carnithine racemase